MSTTWITTSVSHACYVAFVLITFSSFGMKRYVVALEKEERDELAGITPRARINRRR